MENKRKFKVSGKLIFNVLVFAVSIYFIVYFFVSEDGLIEGVVMPLHRFVCAVQWHPEFASPDDATAQKLFAAFIAAAR